MKHLDEEQFAAVIAGEADEEARKHAQHCYQCSVEVERMREFVGEFKQAMMAAGERPRRIQPARAAATGWRMALAAAVMACLVVIAVAMLHGSKPKQAVQGPVVVQPQQEQAQKVDPDDQLLLEVDEDLSRSGPRALEPASLIVAARNKHARQ